MKPAKTGALVLMLSLFWAMCAVAHGSSSTIELPFTYSLETPKSLPENTLTHGGMNLHESEKVLISWERHELSRSHKVKEKDSNDRSLRSVIGIDTDDDRKAKGHVIVHTDPEKDCGCTDDTPDLGGSSILRHVQPQAGTF